MPGATRPPSPAAIGVAAVRRHPSEPRRHERARTPSARALPERSAAVGGAARRMPDVPARRRSRRCARSPVRAGQVPRGSDMSGDALFELPDATAPVAPLAEVVALKRTAAEVKAALRRRHPEGGGMWVCIDEAFSGIANGCGGIDLLAVGAWRSAKAPGLPGRSAARRVGKE